MKPQDIKFRCSSLAHIMTKGNEATEKQLETIAKLQAKEVRTDIQNAELDRLILKRDHPELPEGAKTYLADVFASKFYGRREEVTSKYLEKGLEREEDAITLLSRAYSTLFFKNTERLENDYISGEPDLFIGKSIRKAYETLDTKCSWSLFTFMRSSVGELDDQYWWQGQGYCDLTGAQKHTVGFCLVNGTATAINDEKRKVQYRMGILDPASKDEKFLEKCKQIEINHIFDLESFLKENPYFDLDNDPEQWKWDIPMEKRLHTFTFDRDQAAIDKMHKRVDQCREYMEEAFFKIRKAAKVTDEQIAKALETIRKGKELQTKLKKSIL